MIKLRQLLTIIIMLSTLNSCCTISPDMLRRRPSRGTQFVQADKGLVANCIAKRLAETSNSLYDVIKETDLVKLVYGNMTLRVYDLSSSVGGTMVTIYVGSSLHASEGVEIVDYCKKQFKPADIPPEISTQ